jgi:hypothetical protein
MVGASKDMDGQTVETGTKNSPKECDTSKVLALEKQDENQEDKVDMFGLGP